MSLRLKKLPFYITLNKDSGWIMLKLWSVVLVAAARDGLAGMKDTEGANVDPVKASLAAAGKSDADFYRGR